MKQHEGYGKSMKIADEVAREILTEEDEYTDADADAEYKRILRDIVSMFIGICLAYGLNWVFPGTEELTITNYLCIAFNFSYMYWSITTPLGEIGVKHLIIQLGRGYTKKCVLTLVVVINGVIFCCGGLALFGYTGEQLGGEHGAFIGCILGVVLGFPFALSGSKKLKKYSMEKIEGLYPDEIYAAKKNVASIHLVDAPYVNTPTNMLEFLEYISAQETVKPLHHFWARAAITDQPPRLTYALPIGEILAFPRFLVFLSLSKYTPGTTHFLAEFGRLLAKKDLSIFQFERWFDKPINIPKDTSVWLSSRLKNEDKFAETMINPNSFFIPIEDIINVQFNRGIIALREHRIQVVLGSGKLVIRQDCTTENLIDTLIGQFTGHWQDEFISFLNSAIKTNQTKGQ